MRRSFRFIVVAAIAIACDEPSEMHLVDRASSLLITGTLQLGRIGEVSQLRATAIYPDGRRIDVTQAAEWNTAASQIASVDAGGVLTARGFGLGGVTAFFYPVRQTLQVIVTPPGTFILAGRVREPGAGSLSAVTVRHIASGDSAITGNDGRYSLAGVTHPAQLSLTKPGYEPADLLAFPNVFLEPPMQPVIRLMPESTTSQIVAPNDMEYVVTPEGERCQPCRLVRMTSATVGTIRVRVTWHDTDAAINIWVNGRIFRGDSTKQETIADIVVAAGETIFYYGRLPGTTRLSRHTGVTLTAGAVSASL